MRLRRCAIFAVLLGVVLAGAPGAHAAELHTGVAATSAAAKRSCGTERVQPGTRSPTPGLPVGIPYKIIVSRGSVSCRKARSLIKATGEGKGHWHETRAISGIYTCERNRRHTALAAGYEQPARAPLLQ
jgi:hypothetical protein